MDFYLILTTGALNLFLSVLVMTKNSRNEKANRYFAFSIFFVALWSLGIALFREESNLQAAHILGQVVYISITLALLSFFYFSAIFNAKLFTANKWISFSVGLFSFLLILVVLIPRLVIKEIEITGEEKRLIFGLGYYFHSFVTLAFFCWSLAILFTKYKRARGILKYQLKYLFLGLFLTVFIASITNIILPFFGNTELNWLGPASAIFIVGFSSYAIIQLRLMGIKVLLSKIFVVLIIGFAGYGIFYVLLYMAENMLGGIYSPASLILGLVLAMIFARLIFPFLSYIQKSSDYLFFRGDNPSKLIKELTLKISGVIDLEKLVEILNKDFKRLIGTESFSVVYIEKISRQKNGKISLVVAKGGKVKRVKIAKSNALYSRILKERKLIVKDELRDNEKHKKLLSEMKKKNTDIIAPLEAQNEIVGVILIGEKATQNAYTKEDIEFIEMISYQVATVIENTRLYKEVKEFNEKLKKEIKKATKNVQKANLELKGSNEKLVGAYAKLHKLDRAKSEFLSIASHQLRTPLTSIKGFTSLLMEGTYGPVSTQVKEILQKVFLSNERLIRLVEDLLNISRIESGRFVFDVRKCDITILLREVTDSFTIPVKAKKLSLKATLPKVKVQNLHFDRNKLREVVSNLIDNAVKYSDSGTITVKLQNKRDRVRVSIEDKGLGIPKGELDYIFDKFQRGKDINNVHTEGVGLGLYVCKKVVEAHKGKIWAESKGPGKGSTFIFELMKGLKAEDMAKKVE